MTDAQTSPGASLRRAVLIALALAVAAWVAASFAIARNILVDSMIEHELDDGDALGRRILRLVDVELSRLERSARDWATWDETWAYARGEDAAYVERNVYDGVLANLGIDLMAIVAADGSVRFVRLRDADAAPPDPVPTLLGRDGAWLEPQRSDRAQQGLVRTARGPLAFVALPIHRSQPDDPGANAGTLVFGRFLDEGFVAELQRILRAELSLHAPEDTAIPDIAQALRRLGDDSVHVILLDDTRLATHAALRDLWGQPIAILRAVSERSAYAQARRAERGLLLASLAVGLAAGLGFYGFMASRVLAPLQRLDTAVRDVARGGGGARLPATTVDDEFARLGNSVNAMLDELDAQRDAREARDAAQLASRMKGELLVHLGQTTAVPLTELQGALEQALRDDGLSSVTRARLEEAYRAAFHIRAELRGLPEFSRDAQPEPAAPAAPFALRELLEQVADAAAARAVTRGVTVDCEIDPALGAHYLGEAGRLQSTLNLMFDELEREMPTADLLLRVRLAAIGTQQDSIDLSVAHCGRIAAPREAAPTRMPAARRDDDGPTRLRQAVAALGGLLQAEAGRLQMTLQWSRITGTAELNSRPYPGRRVLVLGASRVSRDILEAYLKSLGCHVVTTETVQNTTPRDVALTLVLVDEFRAGTPLEPPLPGTPTLFILPTGAPPPAARPETACLHRPLHWSALRAAIDELGSPAPVADTSLADLHPNT